jgi:DNA-binding phage protein
LRLKRGCLGMRVVVKLAKMVKAGISGEGLYRALSPDGNPTVATVQKVPGAIVGL